MSEIPMVQRVMHGARIYAKEMEHLTLTDRAHINGLCDVVETLQDFGMEILAENFKLRRALQSAKEVLDIAADHGLYQAGSIGEADLNECARLINEALGEE